MSYKHNSNKRKRRSIIPDCRSTCANMSSSAPSAAQYAAAENSENYRTCSSSTRSQGTTWEEDKEGAPNPKHRPPPQFEVLGQMRRVFAAAPPIVKYKKAPQAPKRFKSSYVINCSVLFELVRTVRFVETNIFHHPCLFCFFWYFLFVSVSSF